MPNPRDRIKGTGDTHPPEVEDDLAAEPEGEGAARLARNRAAAMDAAGARSGTAEPRGTDQAASAEANLAAGGNALLDQAREHVRAHPLLAVGLAFVVGFLVGPRGRR